MNTEDYINLLKNNHNNWNKWRTQNKDTLPDFSNVNFSIHFWGNDLYDFPEFDFIDFSNSDLNCASLRNCCFYNCCFDGSKITYADLVDANFYDCSFKNVNMAVSRIGNTQFYNCTFTNTNLSYCTAEKTSFKGSTFENCNLSYISFVKSNFSETKLENCQVYGISSWDLNLSNSTQSNLIITPENHSIITVDNIELAQFLYLVLSNTKLRDVIDTITSKVVLILGNFSEERMAILIKVKEILRNNNLIPVIFSFSKPSSRNLTETIITLTELSKFVIVDLSSPRSSPHELASIIPHSPSISFYPIILEGETPYGMFCDYQSYHWVKEIKYYTPENINIVVDEIINSTISKEQ